jgi:hypothetical protein
MIRGIVAIFLVVLTKFVLAAVVGWLANRRHASPIHVGAVVNTVLLAAVVLAIDQFRTDGLTLYSVFFALLMLWLAYSAANYGNVGFRVCPRQHRRRLSRSTILTTGTGPVNTMNMNNPPVTEQRPADKRTLLAVTL